MLIINADDWGGWASATDAAWDCFTRGRITSVSAMLFMEDSERAAELAERSGIDVGLHVNFNEPFTGEGVPPRLLLSHERLRRFLRCNRYAQLVYNPVLRDDFRCVYDAQLDEFRRLYRGEPSHIDGHQHMHLCANMLFQGIIDQGRAVRRSFSFWPGEKSVLNRFYRRCVDKWLSRHYRSTDYFFSLAQALKAGTVRRIAELAQCEAVELMTHPENSEEYSWLMGERFEGAFGNLRLGSYSGLSCNLPVA
jgi:predicted glycoside hydrolase/deacetylase ChbG (UPF0249 family)